MTAHRARVTFTAPKLVPYRGGCVTEPTFFALDYLVNYRSDMTVADQELPQVVVLEVLRQVLADPAAYQVTCQDALAAKQRFLESAGQALEAEGGRVAWLEKEFLVR